jgi:hypothetical protein
MIDLYNDNLLIEVLDSVNDNVQTTKTIALNLAFRANVVYNYNLHKRVLRKLKTLAKLGKIQKVEMITDKKIKIYVWRQNERTSITGDIRR